VTFRHDRSPHPSTSEEECQRGEVAANREVRCAARLGFSSRSRNKPRCTKEKPGATNAPGFACGRSTSEEVWIAPGKTTGEPMIVPLENLQRRLIAVLQFRR
jgi:hypothetical protein